MRPTECIRNNGGKGCVNESGGRVSRTRGREKGSTRYNGHAEDPYVITHRHPSSARSRLRLIINARRNVRQTTFPFRWETPRGRTGPFTSLISCDCGSPYFAHGRRKKMSFAAVSRRPRMLTNYCGRSTMLTKGESKSQCPATGVRLDGISLRRNLISSRARVRESVIERLARIGYPALTSRTGGKRR